MVTCRVSIVVNRHDSPFNETPAHCFTPSLKTILTTLKIVNGYWYPPQYHYDGYAPDN